MTPLTSAELAAFARRYRFVGGRLLRVRLRHRGTRAELEVVVAVRRAIQDLGVEAGPVKLKLRLGDVEEYRFQKRLGGPAGKVPDVKFGYFNDLFYIAFDDWSLGPGERPAVHDFRGTDTFAAGRTLEWEEVERIK